MKKINTILKLNDFLKRILNKIENMSESTNIPTIDEIVTQVKLNAILIFIGKSSRNPSRSKNLLWSK